MSGSCTDSGTDGSDSAIIVDDKPCTDSPIDSLPTELLVHTFSWLCLDDLGRNVSKVCQRWKDALHFKTLWVNKELVYEYGQEDLFVFILSVAPSLKKITIDPIVCKDAIVDAICKGTEDVKAFHFNISLFPPHVTAQILNHYKDHVCDLHLAGNDDNKIGIKNLGALLGRMSQLRYLKFSGNVNMDYFSTKRNKSVLDSGCLKLNHFDISSLDNDSDSYSPLLDSVKSHLITLKLPLHMSNVGVFESVASCSQLKEITLGLYDLRCIKSLQSLESLHIKWSDIVLEARGRMKKFIQTCSVFEKLKELTMHYIDASLAFEIVKRCQNLEVLSMHGITSCAKIIKVVSSLKRLCIVDRVSLRLRHVQKLPSYLPNLVYLDLLGSFANQGLPPKIILQLKERLPGLHIESKPFLRYTKHGNKGIKGHCTDSSTDCSSDEA